MLSLGHHSSSPRRTLPCLIVKLPKETCGTAGHRRVVRHDLLFGKVPVSINIEIYCRLGSSVASKRASHAAVIQALSWIAPCSRGSRHPHARGASNWQRRRELPWTESRALRVSGASTAAPRLIVAATAGAESAPSFYSRLPCLHYRAHIRGCPWIHSDATSSPGQMVWSASNRKGWNATALQTVSSEW